MEKKSVVTVMAVMCRLSFLIVMVFVPPVYADTLITPTDAGINYYGRFNVANPAKPRCGWSGAVIEASFPGPTIGMRMEYADALYDVEIDGKLDTIISTGSQKDFIFRKNLSTQQHTVRIILRSENHYGAGTFSGLYLANGKVLGTPPVKPDRKIEFIGDSYTAGYGIESSGRTCNSDELNKYTNANRTFAMLVTSAFHAQSIILGWSGAGMVRNYGEGGKRSADPFPVHYDSTLGNAGEGGKWDYTKWKPDLVVICLGTNDYSTTPHPDDSMYVGDYHKFIARIIGQYPEASVLCVSTGDATFEKNVRRVVTDENSTLNHPKVYFAPYPPSLENTGCDWHPSIADNVKVAAALADTIKKKLSWDAAAIGAASPLPAEKGGRAMMRLSGGMVRERLEIVFAGECPSASPILLVNMRGAVIARKPLGAGNRCVFTMDHCGAGVYLAGNPDYGWVAAVVRR